MRCARGWSPLAEALGEQGVYADADADAERDHKILNREGDGDGCERGLADARATKMLSTML